MGAAIFHRSMCSVRTEYWILFGKGNINEQTMFWEMTGFCVKLLQEEWEVNQQEGGEIKCYTIWQITVAYVALKRDVKTLVSGGGIHCCL